MGDSQITIELTADEALVLSHWLEKLQMITAGGLRRLVSGCGRRTEGSV
ncbi:hypothetical protein [Streptomyces sp. NPDC088746]